MLDIVVISVHFNVRSTGIASASLNRNGSTLIDFSNGLVASAAIRPLNVEELAGVEDW
jgi:hypothetical protein